MAVEFEPTTQHIQQGLAATLSVTFYADGVVADPDVTTVTITRLDGTAIATDAATSGSGAAARTYALTSVQTADLDILTVAWDSATYGTVEQTVEITGGVLFTIREARAYDNGAMASAATYPTATIEEARARVTDEFKRICGVSFVPRIERVTLDGAGDDWLFLPRLRVLAVRDIEVLDTTDGTWTAYTVDELADVQILDLGRVRRLDGTTFVSGRQNVRVTYEHGWRQPPLAIRQAALAVLRFTLVPGNFSERAISLSSEFGTTQLSTPNPERGRYYGLPVVDAVIDRYVEKVPVVG